MIRQAMNVLSWIIIAGGVLIVTGGVLFAVERGGSLVSRVQELILFAVFSLVTIAAGAVLQMLVRIDERLERQGPSPSEERRS